MATDSSNNNARHPFRRLVVGIGLAALAIPCFASAAHADGSLSTVRALPNPDLKQACGLDMALVLDRSASIGHHNEDVRAAARALIAGEAGTGGRIEVASYATTASAYTAADDSVADGTALHLLDPATIALPAFPSDGSTNWDDALELVRRGPDGVPPLVVMVTDGNPTVHDNAAPDGHGTGVMAGGSGATTGPADIDNAVEEANRLRAAGAHVFVVGVGDATTDPDNVTRIQQLSGPTELSFAAGAPSVPFGVADYTLVPSFGDLESAFEGFNRALCASTVVATAVFQMPDGRNVTANAQSGVVLHLALAPAPKGGQPAPAVTTSRGAVTFRWDPADPLIATAPTLQADLPAGFDANGATCSVNHNDGSAPAPVADLTMGPALPAPALGTAAVALPPLAASDSAACTLYLRASSSAVQLPGRPTLTPPPAARPEPPSSTGSTGAAAHASTAAPATVPVVSSSAIGIGAPSASAPKLPLLLGGLAIFGVGLAAYSGVRRPVLRLRRRAS